MKIIELQGGYFNGMVYGRFEDHQVPDEILLHYYVNPRAEMQGVTILGITEKGPDDITKVLRYKQSDAYGDTLIFALDAEIDPFTVRKNEETGELEMRDGAEEDQD